MQLVLPKGKAGVTVHVAPYHLFFIGPFLRFFVFKLKTGMEITINGQSSKIAAPCTLEQLVSELFPSAKGIAVAVNQSVVPKSDWPSRQLSPNDHLTFITATQGG